MRKLYRNREINPFCHYTPAETRQLGKFVGVSNPRGLVLLRRQLRHVAQRHFDRVAFLPVGDEPQERGDWLREKVAVPTLSLSATLAEFRASNANRLMDLMAAVPVNIHRNKMLKHLKFLQLELEKLGHLAAQSEVFVRHSRQKLKPLEWAPIVEELSQLFSSYRPELKPAINSRHPDNSDYMQFVTKAAEVFVGRHHPLKEYMKTYVKLLKEPQSEKAKAVQSKSGPKIDQ